MPTASDSFRQLKTKTSKKEIKSALEIFQRELRESGDAGSGGGSGGGGAHNQQRQQGTFAPVPPAGVQNMAALYLKVNGYIVAVEPGRSGAWRGAEEGGARVAPSLPRQPMCPKSSEVSTAVGTLGYVDAYSH